jgi:aryl-alcohol dehydrogenase-like predicted oxidoreductase
MQGSGRFLNGANLAVVDRLIAFAEERDHTLLDLAFSWLAARPIVSSVIAGATRPEQVDGNIRAVAWKLSRDDLAEIDRITNGR